MKKIINHEFTKAMEKSKKKIISYKIYEMFTNAKKFV